MNVDAGIDYRLRTLTQAHLWLSPLNSETREQMDKLWLALAGARALPGRRWRSTIASCRRWRRKPDAGGVVRHAVRGCPQPA
jgi:cell division protein ZapE